MSRALLWPVVVVAACSSGSRADCERRTEQLGAAMQAATVDGSGAMLFVPSSIEPVHSESGLPLATMGPVVHVGAAGQLTFNGDAVTSDELAERLRADRAMAADFARPATNVVYVLPDRRAPVADLAAAVVALPDGLEARRVVRAPAPRNEVPRRLAEAAGVKKLQAEIASGDASARATAMAKHIQDAVGTCTPLVKLFGDLATGSAASKGRMLADGAPSALRACGCKVADLDVLEFALLSVSGAFDTPNTWLPIRFAPGGAGLGLAPGATAAALVAAIASLPDGERAGPFALPASDR
jgi:hypothetical protein